MLLARVGRHVIKEWNSVEYIIYTVFDQSPTAFQKLDTLVKPEQVKDIQAFLTAHASDSPQPMTCGG